MKNALIILSLFCSVVRAEWQPLFNSTDLSGWHTSPGGTWVNENGTITGVSEKAEKRHGLLISDGVYSNFTAQLEFKSHYGNSGFYFRSALNESSAARINGFQAEIEPAYATGGLYETGGRGWVIKPDPQVIKAIYSPGEWTKMSVQARDGSVTVSLNGQVTAELRNDPGRRSGHLALQLHGSQDLKVQFRNLTIREEAPLPPAPVEKQIYLGRRIAQTMHWKGAGWLLRKEREREESALEMIEQLRLQSGQSVCDLGAGNGYHTLMMAEQVGPTGKVYAVDIQQEMLDLLQGRAREANLENIQPILGEYHDPHLPKDSLDLILLVDAYHEFSHPVTMLDGIRRGLKKDGLVALVEFRSEDLMVPIKPDHKMSKAQIMKEFSANGFKLVRSYDDLPWQHLMFFKRIH